MDSNKCKNFLTYNIDFSRVQLLSHLIYSFSILAQKIAVLRSSGQKSQAAHVCTNYTHKDDLADKRHVKKWILSFCPPIKTEKMVIRYPSRSI